jgi:cytoskeletal protein RodZ
MMNDESSNTTDNSMGLLGDYLKQRRLDKNFSLEKLSQKTKISINILKSLETNDFDHLPSAAYIKGFVVSYVKVLGLPLDEAINKMEYTYLSILGKPFPALNHTKLMTTPVLKGQPGQASSETDSEPVAEPSPEEVISNSDSIIEHTKSILPFAILIFVILLFIGGYKIISSIVENEVNSEKSTDLGPKIESSSALLNIPAKVPEKTKTEDTAAKSPEAATTTEKKEEPPKPALDFVRNFPTMEFKKVTGKLFSAKTDASENDDTSILPDTIKNAINSDIQNIYIRAVSGNTWLSYKIDNNPIESAIINQGKDLFLQGSEIRLFLGNVNVTKIFYNNYMIETPTKTGVKSLIFPEESNDKFQLPLFPKAKDDVLYTSEDYIKRMNLEEEELKKRNPTTN